MDIAAAYSACCDTVERRSIVDYLADGDRAEPLHLAKDLHDLRAVGGAIVPPRSEQLEHPGVEPAAAGKRSGDVRICHVHMAVEHARHQDLVRDQTVIAGGDTVDTPRGDDTTCRIADDTGIPDRSR